MLVIDEAKLPPPTPANAATISRVVYERPRLQHDRDQRSSGSAAAAALTIVQFRPPNVATANV